MDRIEKTTTLFMNVKVKVQTGKSWKKCYMELQNH